MRRIIDGAPIRLRAAGARAVDDEGPWTELTVGMLDAAARPSSDSMPGVVTSGMSAVLAVMLDTRSGGYRTGPAPLAATHG